MAWNVFPQEFKEQDGRSYWRLCAINSETGSMHLTCRCEKHATSDAAIGCTKAATEIEKLKASDGGSN